MGMERYEFFVRRARNVLTYDPGWSGDNRTGAWRALRPVLDEARCTSCDLCWLYCPDGSIARTSLLEHTSEAIDLRYCKGCGICAAECPRDAIAMVREAE